MIRARRRWLLGGLLVVVGVLLSPQLVPVYDGLTQPDEPYRYVAPPPDYRTTKPPGTVEQSTPVTAGLSANGLDMSTGEMSPQFDLFIPPGSLKAGGAITVRTVAVAPTGSPSGAKVEGNAYDVSVTAAAGPVTLTDQVALATLYMRAVNQKVPQPTMFYRATGTQEWVALRTSAQGLDVRVASWKGPGQYVLATVGSATKSGPPVVVIVLIVLLVGIVGVVFVIRRRATAE